MKQITVLVLLGTALSAWPAASSATFRQHSQTSHGGATQGANSANDTKLDKQIEQLLVGLTDAEKKQLRSQIAQVPPEHRKMMIDHMMSLSPEERRKMVQQVLKGGAGGSAQQMHGHARGARHGGHGADGEKPAPGALAVGDKVPDFVVRDLKGRAIRLSELRKKTKSGVVSLTFWCSFCHSCRGVEETLDRNARDYKGKAIVAVLDASAGETVEKVSAFAKKTGLTLPILMDAPGKTADLFGVNVTTSTVVIDGKGTLRYRGRFVAGAKTYATDALDAVLAGKDVPVKETTLAG